MVTMIKNVFLSLLLLFSSPLLAQEEESIAPKIAFRTSFGGCPKKVAGAFAIIILQEFERTHSLRSVKKKISQEKLTQKHFVSQYSIKYNPMRQMLDLQLECPEPFMNVQFFKESGLESFNAILVANGELYDPSYEMLLNTENKIAKKLPFLALPDPAGDLESGVKKQIAAITEVIRKMTPEFRSNLSEIIITDKLELTIILSVEGRTSSVFFGQQEWGEKVLVLQRTIKYLLEKKRIPSIINLTDSKKMVVKFVD